MDSLNQFLDAFSMEQPDEEMMVDGIFGYTTYDAVEYFEDITFSSRMPTGEEIPEIRYNFFRYVLAINHLSNELILFEHLVNGGESQIDRVTTLLHNRNIATFLIKGQNLDKLNKAYCSGTALVNPIQLKESISHLKDLMYREKRKG